MASEQLTPKFYASLLQEWLQTCNECHGNRCHTTKPISERPEHSVPEWVIDTQKDCIVPGSSVEAYVALSYVWQSPGRTSAPTAERLMLQKANLDNFRRPGYLDVRILAGAPAVVKDAIDLVKLSGLRYLWIDCLCIVQYDETTRVRVGLMNEIYSGAYLTIVAAAQSEGLYGSHFDPDMYYRGAFYPWNAQESTLCVQKLHGGLLGSYWASRGWTFQEQLLSKRSLIFMNEVCFWECETEIWCPSKAGNQSDARTPTASRQRRLATNSDLKKHREIHPLEVKAMWGNTISRWDLAASSPIADFGIFVELVCRYSNRSLTYDQDTIPAFSGVLDAFTKHSFPGGFICGLPSLFLDSALIWQPLLKARRRSAVTGVDNIAPASPLPSWSWVGWQCLLDPASLESGESYAVPELDACTTEKSVDWSILTEDGLLHPIEEPGILQRLITLSKTNPHGFLPTGWSSKTYEHTWNTNPLNYKKDDNMPGVVRRSPTSRTYGTRSWERAGIRLVDTDLAEPEDISRVFKWFVHDSQPGIPYRYPLPPRETDSDGRTEANEALLSCITTKATLRVCEVLTATSTQIRHREAKCRFSVSIRGTEVYQFSPSLQEYCPVLTLEDAAGNWAGIMQIMDGETTVQPKVDLEMIAISTGSMPQAKITRTYPGAVGIRRTWHREREGYIRENVLYSGYSGRRDKIPMATNANHGRRWYFYNVLWVEAIDGIMYRKAAGRVSKEIWEQTCGEPVRIVLG